MIYSGSCDSTNCYSSTPHTPNSGEQITILLLTTTTTIIIIIITIKNIATSLC